MLSFFFFCLLHPSPTFRRVCGTSSQLCGAKTDPVQVDDGGAGKLGADERGEAAFAPLGVNEDVEEAAELDAAVARAEEEAKQEDWAPVQPEAPAPAPTPVVRSAPAAEPRPVMYLDEKDGMFTVDRGEMMQVVFLRDGELDDGANAGAGPLPVPAGHVSEAAAVAREAAAFDAAMQTLAEGEARAFREGQERGAKDAEAAARLARAGAEAHTAALLVEGYEALAGEHRGPPARDVPPACVLQRENLLACLAAKADPDMQRSSCNAAVAAFLSCAREEREAFLSR